MSLRRYRDVLALPGTARLLGFAVLARIPQTAGGVVLTLHVVGGLGLGYAAAGVVSTAVTVGMAASGPWRGRVVDRRGLRPALVPSVIGSALAWGAAPFLGYGPLIAVAFVGGLLGVPIFGIVRQSLAVLVPVEQRRTAYALDSIGTEISFMIGPAAGVLLATQYSGTVALLTVGGTTVAAGLGLIALNPPTRSVLPAPDAVAAVPEAVPAQLRDVAGSRPPGGPDSERVGEPAPASPGESTPGAVGEPDARSGVSAHWYSPGLLAVLAAALAAGLVLAGTDVGLVAQLRNAGALSLTGLVFLAWSGGSVIGGAVYGAARRSVSATVLLLWLALLTVPVGLAPSPILLAVTILPAAALCAPLISSTAEAVSRLVPEHVRGEAMGWHGSALTVGSALGAPIAGAAIDGVAPWAGFAAVGAVGGGLAAVGLVLQRGRRESTIPASARRPASLGH